MNNVGISQHHKDSSPGTVDTTEWLSIQQLLTYFTNINPVVVLEEQSANNNSPRIDSYI